LRYGGHDPSRPLLDLSDSKAQDANTLVREEPGATTFICLLLFIVNWAIDLNAQLRAGAVEIENEWADGVLAAEMQTQSASTEHGP
jgi:hypothetical protein